MLRSSGLSGSPSQRRNHTLRRVPRFQGLNDVDRSIRKTVSYGALQDVSSSSSSDEDSDDGNGIKLSSSPTGWKAKLPVKSASDNGGFQLGSFAEDDIFEPNLRESVPAESKDTALLAAVPEEDSAKSLMKAPMTLDPQAVYPPDFCIFVANLPQAFDNEILEKEITQVFSHFGTVFVKMKRDRRQMPFAFVQFTNEANARRAAEEGRGLLILGRSCRTEMCNGSVTFIIYKKTSDMVTNEEAEQLLRPYGQIAKIEETSRDLRTRLGLPHSLIVTYAMYDAKRDVVKAIGCHTNFIVLPYDSKVASDGDRAAPEGRAFLDQYDRDRRSAYFGGLPEYVDQKFVHLLASRCGTVQDVQLRQTRTSTGEAIRFAFVLYDSPDAPDEAVEYYNNNVINGFHLRVERKRARKPETPQRLQPYGPVATSQSFDRQQSTSHTRNIARGSLAMQVATSSPRGYVSVTPAGPSKGRYVMERTQAPSSCTSSHSGAYSQRNSEHASGNHKPYTPMGNASTSRFSGNGSGSVYYTPGPYSAAQHSSAITASHPALVQQAALSGSPGAPQGSQRFIEPLVQARGYPSHHIAAQVPALVPFHPCAQIPAAASPYGGTQASPRKSAAVAPVDVAHADVANSTHSTSPAGIPIDPVKANRNVTMPQTQMSHENAAQRAANRAAERLGVTSIVQEGPRIKASVVAPTVKHVNPEARHAPKDPIVTVSEATTEVADQTNVTDVNVSKVTQAMEQVLAIPTYPNQQAPIQHMNAMPQYPPAYGYNMPAYLHHPMTPQVNSGMQYGYPPAGHYAAYDAFGNVHLVPMPGIPALPQMAIPRHPVMGQVTPGGGMNANGRVTEVLPMHKEDPKEHESFH